MEIIIHAKTNDDKKYNEEQSDDYDAYNRQRALSMFLDSESSCSVDHGDFNFPLKAQRQRCLNRISVNYSS